MSTRQIAAVPISVGDPDPAKASYVDRLGFDVVPDDAGRVAGRGVIRRQCGVR